MNADDSRIERNVDFLIVIVGFRVNGFCGGERRG